MRQIFLIIFILLLIGQSCKNGSSNSGESIVTIGNNVLTRDEVEAFIPVGTSSEDSIIAAESYVRSWIRDVLLYNIASKNIKNEDEIDQLVENYRRSLISYQYQEQLLKEKMSTEISEAEMLKYYEENGNIFILDKNLVQGLFLKIPSNSPDINKVQGWYRSTSGKDLENIEKYSVRYASIYDYFYDRWVDLDEELSKMPNTSPDRMSRLLKNRCLMESDSIYTYFLNVTKILSVGDKAPFEYAKANIKEIILNQKRLDFIHRFEEDLYNSALKKGEIKFSETR